MFWVTQIVNEKEHKLTWGGLMKKLEYDMQLENSLGWTIISDQQKPRNDKARQQSDGGAQDFSCEGKSKVIVHTFFQLQSQI